jgi:4-aminobutyrate aminotransferase-like enzyme
VVDAAFAQARELSHLRSNFDSVPLLLLAKAMTDAAPGDLNRIGFTLHGSLAVEMAMKLAMQNRPQHTGPWLALTDGYHGRSLASMGLGWPHPNHAFDRTFPAVLRVPQPYAYRSGRSPDDEVDYCIGELRDAILRRATGLPPAFFMEPVQGNGAQLDFPRRYYQEVRQVCTEHGILLVFDEVQTGFGRTGSMWAAEHYGVVPDILVFGKGVGGGFPLAGVLSSTGLAGFQPGDDALTFGEFPVSLAAGLAALEVLRRDGLLQACADMGRYATDALHAMQPRHPLIGDIRGPGLLIGVELVRDRRSKEPASAVRPSRPRSSGRESPSSPCAPAGGQPLPRRTGPPRRPPP